MENPSDLLNEIMEETKNLKEKFPQETNAFLDFMKKAESGPVLTP